MKIQKFFCFATGNYIIIYFGVGIGIIQASLKLPILLLVCHSLYLLPACPGIFSFSLNSSHIPLSASLPIPFCVDRLSVHRCISSSPVSNRLVHSSDKMNCKLSAILTVASFNCFSTPLPSSSFTSASG